MRYAISDIHGCAATLRQALRVIDLQAEDELFLLGDYIDRGPDSMGVLETIWELESDGYRLTCLRGNHEQMLIDHHRGRAPRYDWVPPPERAERTIAWMEGLPHYHETPGYLLVHAGFEFRAGAPLANRDSMLWIRDWYGDLDRDWLGDRIIVHGHTPDRLDNIREGVKHMQATQRVCIDSGCAWDKPGMRHLTVLCLDDRSAQYVHRVT